MQVEILKPYGYCSGVKRAIEMALAIRKENPSKKVFILGKLVHNQFVIDFLSKKGIKTITSLNDVAPYSILIFSAHGHIKEIEDLSASMNIITYDAICPLVKKNIELIRKENESNHEIIYIGFNSHPESKAALSYGHRIHLYDLKTKRFDYSIINDDSPFVINQTTLNIKDLDNIIIEIKQHIPNARISNEICMATRLRQESLINLANDVDGVVVVGDPSSSNSNRLMEIIKKNRPEVDSCFVNNVDQLPNNFCHNKKHVVITSGTSTPYTIIDSIYKYLTK